MDGADVGKNRRSALEVWVEMALWPPNKGVEYE